MANVALVRDPTGTFRSTRKGRLIFSEKYYHGLVNYARVLGLPMLVAWKVRDAGLWFLFDIRAMQKTRQAYHADISEVAKQDLMGILLGNVFSQVAAGSGWVMEIAKLEETGDDSFVGRVDRSVLVGADGHEYHGRGPMLSLLAECEDEVEVSEVGGVVTQSIRVRHDSGIIAYRLLPRAVRGFSDKPIHWLTTLRDHKFLWSYSQLQDTMNEGMQLGFVNYVMHPYPSVTPDFLKGKLRR